MLSLWCYLSACVIHILTLFILFKLILNLHMKNIVCVWVHHCHHCHHHPTVLPSEPFRFSCKHSSSVCVSCPAPFCVISVTSFSTLSLVFPGVLVKYTYIWCSQRGAGACVDVTIMSLTQKLFLQCRLWLFSCCWISCLLEVSVHLQYCTV